jgi:predicted transcriptional regulator
MKIIGRTALKILLELQRRHYSDLPPPTMRELSVVCGCDYRNIPSHFGKMERDGLITRGDGARAIRSNVVVAQYLKGKS